MVAHEHHVLSHSLSPRKLTRPERIEMRIVTRATNVRELISNFKCASHGKMLICNYLTP